MNRLLFWHTNSDFYGVRTPTFIPYEPFLLGVGVVFKILICSILMNIQHFSRSFCISKFHFARFTLSCPSEYERSPPSSSHTLPRPASPVPRPVLARPRPFLARPVLARFSPGLARPLPGPRPPSFQAIWPSKRAKEKFTILYQSIRAQLIRATVVARRS